MLDRLPPEILDAILVLTYPPSPWPDMSDKDKERRQSLTKLSLVCKVISAVSQNLLWRKLSVESGDDLELTRRLQKLETPLKARVQTVRTRSHVALKEMLVVVPLCPGVKKLQCMNGWTTWEQLSGFSTLRTIELLGSELRPERNLAPVPLPPLNLVRLTLLGVIVSNWAELERLLEPNALPNLRALWLGTCGTLGGIEGYVPVVTPSFARQLEMIQLDYVPVGIHGDEPPSPYLYSLPTAVLETLILFSYQFDEFAPYSTLPQHVRITSLRPTSLHDAVEITGDLQTLVDFVHTSANLRSLLLPSFLTSLAPLPSLARSKRDELLKACTAKKVDVVWHDEECELSFSKAFWAYAKRLKVQAVEAGEVVQEASTAA